MHMKKLLVILNLLVFMTALEVVSAHHIEHSDHHTTDCSQHSQAQDGESHDYRCCIVALTVLEPDRTVELSCRGRVCKDKILASLIFNFSSPYLSSLFRPPLA